MTGTGTAPPTALGFQQDIYQRYGFLTAVLEALLRDGADAARPAPTVLDVGCGPAPLTAAFLTDVELIRADVDDFGDTSIVRIRPGAPLPFADGSADIVIALDVLEHVPRSQRRALVGECERVARRAVVLSHPAGTAEVVDAERQFGRWTRHVAGAPIAFLEEHARFGLPDATEVATWFGTARHVVFAENSPLAEWLFFNLVDYLYAFELGDGEEKRAFNESVNSERCWARLGEPHYRSFVCACRDEADADRVRAATAALRRPASSALERTLRCSAALTRLHADVRLRLERVATAVPLGLASASPFAALVQALVGAIAAKDAHIAGLGEQSAFLKGAIAVKDAQLHDTTSVLEAVRENAVHKDVHIAGLEQRSSVLVRQLADLHERLAAASASRHAAEAGLAQRDDALRARAEHLMAAVQARAALESELAGLRAALATQEASGRASADDLARLREHATAVRAELDAVHASRSWTMTAGLRAAAGRTRALRRSLRTLAPAAMLRQWDRWKRERVDLARLEASGAFDRDYYLRLYPDVALRQVDPLRHFLRRGAREGRRPNALFDDAFYNAQRTPEPGEAQNALLHYLGEGVRAGLDPHPLFDTSFYLQRYVDVATSGMNPLGHYLRFGGREGRDPHPDFDSSYYLEHNRDVAEAGLNPLVHYLLHGWREGRDPSREFDTAFYLNVNTDVAAAGMNPLVHFVTAGRREGRAPRRPTSGTTVGYTPAPGLLPWFNPLNARIAHEWSDTPALNLLLPRVGMGSTSGGPNTAMVLACKLAEAGVRVRFVSADLPLDQDVGPFLAHLRALLQREVPSNIEFLDAHDRTQAAAFGRQDVFLATAWWTAQQAKYVSRLTSHPRFIYLIQDFEPLLHAASTQYALALETYALDHVPVVNSRLLFDYLVEHRIGRFADPAFVASAHVFEPALDRAHFHPPATPHVSGRRRLLFYARPQHGLRNLFELGVAALQTCVAEGVLDAQGWEFHGMGESFSPVPLGEGAALVPAPWRDLSGYAQQFRESDILLSLMLSPHPSYPPLEMAASGGLVVTTSFETKSAARLRELSPNIIGVAPAIEAIAEGLREAVARLSDWPARLAASAIDLPSTWDESLAPVVPALVDDLALMLGAPRRTAASPAAGIGSGSHVAPGFRGWPRDRYERFRRDAVRRRRSAYASRPEPGLVSFLTTVWNTRPEYLEALAESVFAQDAGDVFEWVLLDNGSVAEPTRQLLARMAAHPTVRFHRAEENLGIVGGMRFCLERATGRYVLPLDSDDLLTPDCVRVVGHALAAAGYPAIAYTDEDRVIGDWFTLPYHKPDWDPVLFANSCYIAHLGLIDREEALRLGCYTDADAEGSHDWDTFTRFFAAGHTPLHVPEVLYSWRTYEESTAGNIHAKSYIFDSQRRVLSKLARALVPAGDLRLEHSPLFGDTPDWWLSVEPARRLSVTTVVLASAGEAVPPVPAGGAASHEVVRLDPGAGVAGLAALARRLEAEGRYLHILWSATVPDGDRWALDAAAQFTLFPDAAMVGGRVVRDGRVLYAGRYFGFGRGCDSPDRGRPASDPGYFAQMLKPHSVSAVTADHAVLEPAFATSALDSLAGTGVSLAALGAWLGAEACRRERRVVFSPFVTATSSLDLDSRVTDIECDAFRRVHRTLIPEGRLLSPHLGLTPDTAYQSADSETRRASMRDAPGAADDLAVDALARRVRLATAVRGSAGIALLTLVYERSPVEFFKRTAESVLAQTHRPIEWVLLVNGPVPDALDAAVAEVAADARVRVLRSSENVGIINGLRACLEAAQSDYVAPLDADDLLEPDALELMASELAARYVDLAFSDEDHVAGTTMHTPMRRADFDPVLNLENSYVWHLTVFRRDRALALGVYADAGAEFCQDWDAVMRFARAGLSIVHVPHVLYHWRTHDASQSNREAQNPGSVASTRHVVDRVVRAATHPDRYEIAEYPLFRGAIEWWIKRRPVAEPALVAVQIDARGVEAAPGIESVSGAVPVGLHLARSVRRVTSTGDPVALCRAIAGAVSTHAELVVVIDARIEPVGLEWFWEAVKWFELQPDVAIVGGRVLDEHDRVIDAGLVVEQGVVVPFGRGLRRGDPGHFAMALKPRTIEAPAETFFVARAAFLIDAVTVMAERGFEGGFVEGLGAAARARGARVAFSPLIEARSRYARAHVGESAASAAAAGTPREDVAGTAPVPAAAPARDLVQLSPTDWEQVGTQPEFYVRARQPRAAIYHLITREDFLHRGLERAARVVSFDLKPGSADGLLAARPDRPVPPGDYIAVLEDRTTGEIVSAIGVSCRGARDRWVERFDAMLHEQASYQPRQPVAVSLDRPLFSIVTTVYDTDPQFVNALADALFAQRCGDFEWVLLDNGSRRTETREVCRAIAERDARVRLYRVDGNLHIIGGNRYVLERATGEYIVPVDSDDVLYPDALRIFEGFVRDADPDVLYSDEQKITLGGRPSDLLWRPSWSLLFALSTCPASHLMAFRRRLALAANLYTSDYAKGSHDWDSALRLAAHTSHFVRVPYVLYGWRMHPASAAMSQDSKDYLAESQKGVLQQALVRLKLDALFSVELAHSVLGYYHLVRRPEGGPRVLVHAVIGSDDPVGDLATLRKTLASTRYERADVRIYVPGAGRAAGAVGLSSAAAEAAIGGARAEVVTYRDDAELTALEHAEDIVRRADIHVFVNPTLAVSHPDWIWDAVGTFDLDADTGIVGGCILDADGYVQHLGYVAGLEGFMATPAYGRDAKVVYGAMGMLRRHVRAVYGGFMAVRRTTLERIGGMRGIDREDGLFGIELCLRAARVGLRTAYTPRMRATSAARLANPAGVDAAHRARLAREFADLLGEDPYYSRHCMTTSEGYGTAKLE